MPINKAARLELSNLTDEALMELQSMLEEQYRSGYSYCKWRRDELQKLGIMADPHTESDILNAVCRKVPIEEFRAMIRAQ